MIPAATAPATAGTLEVPGARLYYEVRGSGPLVVLIGAPMGAAAFAPLAGLLAGDHTVLTTDPRGTGRSAVEDAGQDSTPEMRADDLSRLIAHVDAGPAAVFGSSGGAVSGLALVEAHPEQVGVLVAHEPPLIELLDDAGHQRGLTDDIVATHQAGDRAGAWRKFLAQAGIELPEPVFQQMFGDDRDPAVLADDDHWFGHELRPTTRWRPDLAVLRSSPARVVIGIGEDSTGEICDRTSRALAAALDLEPALFPGGHIGFADDPAGFAPRLREVLGEG
ncbi:alpha/beta hydrolase [Sphaerisporangium sp. B11E5]|uniref:alpha/beta fold hydrolase n=1 Tax=Sphaerisporangium sp. B11E5 TaxID=3153563 RepID=UPI00325D1C34